MALKAAAYLARLSLSLSSNLTDVCTNFTGCQIVIVVCVCRCVLYRGLQKAKQACSRHAIEEASNLHILLMFPTPDYTFPNDVLPQRFHNELAQVERRQDYFYWPDRDSMSL